MLATTFYILDAILRAFGKAGRNFVLVVDAFIEAQQIRRSISRKYRHVEE